VGSSGVKPSRVWYLVALGLVVGSLVPTYFMARNALDTLEFSVAPIDKGMIEVHDERLSVFAAPHLSSAAISCNVTPASGGRSIPLETSSNDVSISNQDRVGLLPGDLPAGAYQLRCKSGGHAVDVDGFGVRSTEGWTDAILLLVAAILLPIFAGLIAITIAVLTAVRRSSRRRERLQPPPYGSAGFPSAGTPPMP
jgi:hypothetical protein